jgi:hypothetical protein
MNINNSFKYIENGDPLFHDLLMDMKEKLIKYKNSVDRVSLLDQSGILWHFPSDVMTIGEIKAFLCRFDGCRYRYRLTFRSSGWFERHFDNCVVVDLSQFNKFEYELVYCHD